MIYFNSKEKFYDIMQKAELPCRKKTAQQFCFSLSITGNPPHMQHRNGAGVWIPLFQDSANLAQSLYSSLL
ncbi:hypothetical protein, partial [Ruminococcus sp.]|uniref:hypothetical protein n=1 Tax=Ruminococcus sp. TaxID=41978 RepID=UPI003A8FC9C8